MQALLRQEQKWQEQEARPDAVLRAILTKRFSSHLVQAWSLLPFTLRCFFFFCLPLVVAAYGEYSQSTGNGYRRTHEFNELFIHSFIYVSIYKLLSVLDLKMPCIIVPWVYLICFP